MDPRSSRKERRRQAALSRGAGGRAAAIGLLEQGLALQRARRLAEAAAFYRRALDLDPGNADAHVLLGGLHGMEGRIDEAALAFERAIALDPANARAHNNLGIAYRQRGQGSRAAEAFRRALALDPALAEAEINLGTVLGDLGDADGAVAAYGRALALAPQSLIAHFNLARLLDALGRPEEAERHFRQALAIDPNHVEALNGMGALLKTWGREAEAVAFLERAVALSPGHAEALRNLARAQRNLGHFDAALATYRQAAAAHPDDLRARWAALLSLPILYDSEDEIETHRARWTQGLAELESLKLDTPQEIAEARALLVFQTNFNLHYQGRNDRALQGRYGALLARVAAAAYPDFAGAPAPRSSGARLRVGFVSGYFYEHTVPFLFGGWMRGLDRAAFEVHAFPLGAWSDAVTAGLRRSVDVWHDHRADDADLMAHIRAQALDALIYLDIGMDPRTQLPAALRLAPVQCVAWGHPVTSGLPTLDYFLSSALMEPADGDAHYSERLVRLANLSLCCRAPEIEAVAPRESLGRDGPLYLCAQSLFKMLPRHDRLFARIAAEVGRCRFAFIRHQADRVTERFHSRLKRAFAAEGLDADDFCDFRPRMAPGDFLRLNRAADVVLDSLMWSGGRTALEAAACDAPIVTTPGPMMRGRHSFAILKRMGLDECIAADEDAYVALAARLGTDGAWRAEVVAKVRESKARLFDDRAPVRDLEEFLKRACRAS